MLKMHKGKIPTIAYVKISQVLSCSTIVLVFYLLMCMSVRENNKMMQWLYWKLYPQISRTNFWIECVRKTWPGFLSLAQTLCAHHQVFTISNRHLNPPKREKKRKEMEMFRWKNDCNKSHLSKAQPCQMINDIGVEMSNSKKAHRKMQPIHKNTKEHLLSSNSRYSIAPTHN